MLKKTALVAALLLAGASFAFARGSKDFAGTPVNGLENWDYSMDLAGKAPGKYNLLVEAKDKAGNTTIAGPFNIYVDPESDIPLVRVSNPVEGMRVGNNLNIVGTARDDDAVAKVEVKLDGGEWALATGKDYWSYYLDVKDIPDGKHAISVKATDINGVESKPITVSFNLDKFKPVVTVVSHANGVLASGFMAIKGVAKDANGIDKFYVSEDGGKNYREIGTGYDPKADQNNFEYGFDTRAFKDGPKVFWFKAVDKCRSVGYAAFLVFIDNTPPKVDIISPLPTEKGNGRIAIVGSAFDTIGIKSIAYEYGTDKGELPLIPGNPYFYKVFDFSKVTDRAQNVTIRATDTAGNVVTKTVTVNLDPEGDLPVLALRTPADKAVLAGPVPVAGFVTDDDGVAKVLYAVDGKAEVALDAKESFAFTLPELAPGAHKLAFRAQDSNGVLGKKVEINVTAKAAAPAPSFTSYKVGATEAPWRAGAKVAQDGANVVSGRIVAGNALKTVEYALGDEAWKPLSLRGGKTEAEKLFDIPLPRDVRFGIVQVAVRAKDSFDQEGTARSFLYVTNYARINEEPNLAFVDERIDADGRARLGAASPLRGSFQGADPVSVRIEPATDIVAASLDGRLITVSALKQGVTPPLRVVVTTKEGHEFSSAEYRFVTDEEAPAITVGAPAAGAWVGDVLHLEGSAVDNVRLASAEYSIDGGASFQPLELAKEATSGFRADVDLSALKDGPLLLSVRALDESGNAATRTVALTKDSTAPVVKMLTTATEFRGYAPVIARVEEAGYVDSVEYAFSGETPARLPATRFILIPHDYAADSTTLEITVKDRAGNVTKQSATFGLAAEYVPPTLTPDPKTGKTPEPPKPTVELLSPLASEKVNGLVTLAVKFGGGYETFYPKVTCSIDGQKEFPVDLAATAPYFIKDLDYSASRASQSAITFTFEGDKGRKVSQQVKINLDQAADKPLVRLDATPKGPTDKVIVAGAAYDDDGVKEVHYTVDGKGEQVIAAADWFLIAPEGLAPGARKIAVWAVDANGLAGDKVEAQVTVAGAAPTAAFALIGPGKADEAFAPGGAYAVADGTTLKARIAAPNGFKEAEVVVNGGAPRKLGSRAAGADVFVDIPLDRALPYARIEVSLAVTDQFGLKGGARSFFFRVAPAPAYGPVDAPGAYLIDSRVAEDGSVLVTPDNPLRGYFNGRPIKTIELAPATALFSVTADDRWFTVAAAPDAQGISAPTKVTVTTVDGDVFSTQALRLVSDTVAPAFALDRPLTGDWIRGEMAVAGKVTEANGLLKLEYSFDGVAFDELKPAAGPDGSYAIAETFALGEVPDGLALLALKATDAAGNVAWDYVAASKDTVAPELAQVTPGPTDPVNGQITFTGSVKDAGRVVAVDFSGNGTDWVPIAERSNLFSFLLDFWKYMPLPEKFYLRATDAAGNVGVLNPTFNVDQEADKPVAQIQLPTEGEVIRSDFTISGMAFDDDYVAAIYYRIDYKPPETAKPGEIDKATFTRLDGASSFSVPVKLADITDNEHTIEVMAEDPNGVMSYLAKSTFKVSKAEPVSQVTGPDLTKTNKGIIMLTGTAWDANGIKEVYVSFDSGASFHRADGAEDWKYRLDSSILADGTHSITVKAVDKYDTEGLYTTLLSVDNAPPAVTLDSPRDGTPVSGSFPISGRASDTVAVESIKLFMVPSDVPAGTRKDSLEVALPVESIINRTVDISALAPGWYTVRIEVRDKADNVGYVTRNVRVADLTLSDKTEILFPVAGEALAGSFTLSGKVMTKTMPANVALYLDGALYDTLPVNKYGYYSLDIGPDKLADGPHTFHVVAEIGEGKSIKSEPRTVEYKRSGAWLKFTNFKTGDFIATRPFLEGAAGFYADAVDPKDPLYADYRKAVDGARLEKVELSFDGGVSYVDLGGAEKWKYRIETQNYPDGELFILAKASFADGRGAVARIILVVDKTPPTVTLLKPGEEGRFNGVLGIEGIAADNYELDSVTVALRAGDKASYEVPTFIQGLFVDGHMLGSTVWEAGAGLTFIGDNVKVQALIGQAPVGARFDGYVLGVKLIANLSNIPFSYFFGPDWDFFSMSFGVGATFCYFTMSGADFNFNNTGVILGAGILQWEFAKFFFKDWSAFRSFSLYVEGQLWFISSDVAPEIAPKISFGARIGIF